jgi:hypothetical protein
MARLGALALDADESAVMYGDDVRDALACLAV